MKIAFFIRSLNGGGAERVATQLATLWTDMGCDVVLLTQFPPTEHEFECRYAAREQVRLSLSGNAERFADLKSRYELDAVVFNDAINGECFADAIISAKKIGLRVIIINHHTANNWMYGCGNTQELFMDDVLTKADAMVCVDSMWALWWKYRGVKSVFIQNPVCVEPRNTPNTRNGGIELVKSVDEAVEKLRGKKRIIWMGRLRDALKRPELAIEVFAKLVCELVSGGVEELPTLTMLGACDKVTERRLRKLFNSLVPSFHSSSTLIFPGFVTDVGGYLAKADAHLFTSATEVTVPQVVLEAQAAGVETIAFDMPVMRGVVSGGVGEWRSGGVEEKWRKVLAGEAVECDFDTLEVRQLLMDEMHRSQQWFAMHHLPELQRFRVLRQRLNLRYIVKRIIEKIIKQEKFRCRSL